MTTDHGVCAALIAKGSPGMARGRRSRVNAALKLNDELLISIAAKMGVPLQTIFQLRCVCKTWNTVLADQRYLKDFFQLLSQKPLWYTIPARRIGYDLAAYDIGLKCWHKWRSTLHSNFFSLYDVCGDAGDWLLVQKSSILCEPFQGLWLANPTKKLFRKLTSLPGGRDRVPYAMGMGLDESSESCRVFAVDRVDFRWHKVYLYDFELDSWKEFGAWQTNDMERFDSMTFYEGTLHSLCRVPTGGGRSSTSNYFFDERKSRWQELSAQMKGKGRFQHLFQWKGRLMVILGLRGERHQYRDSILVSVHIWQLDEKRHVWVERMRMPDHLVDHFFASGFNVSSFSFTCATFHDQICVTSRTTVIQDASSECKSRHVMCDLSKGLWWDVPEPPFQYHDVSRFSILIPD